jgi:hypothetical protein
VTDTATNPRDPIYTTPGDSPRNSMTEDEAEGIAHRVLGLSSDLDSDEV